MLFMDFMSIGECGKSSSYISRHQLYCCVITVCPVFIWDLGLCKMSPRWFVHQWIISQFSHRTLMSQFRVSCSKVKKNRGAQILVIGPIENHLKSHMILIMCGLNPSTYSFLVFKSIKLQFFLFFGWFTWAPRLRPFVPHCSVRNSSLQTDPHGWTCEWKSGPMAWRRDGDSRWICGLLTD